MKHLSSRDWRNRAGRLRWIVGRCARQQVIAVLLLLAPSRPAFAAVAPAMNQRPSIYNVMDYGLTGHDIGADTAAIQQAIDTCTHNGGGQVVVPAGIEATIATVELKSHVDLHLERGARRATAAGTVAGSSSADATGRPANTAGGPSFLRRLATCPSSKCLQPTTSP